MRRVLFLAYYFPPHGGGGVQRSVRFCQYLPESGYASTVITGPGVDSDGWAPPDETLNERVPRGTGIVRVPGPVPSPSRGRRNRLERAVRRPDPFDRWWLEGATAAGRAAGEDADVVYASMSPFGTADAAAAIAAELGKPWVADLRDPWALDEWRVYPTALHRRLELRRMGRLLSSADAIVMNTREAARALVARFPELARKPVATIPNGFDASDFAGAAPGRSDGAYRIVHAGAVHTDVDPTWTRALRRLLGGEARGLDISTRSHLVLLQAVAAALAARPDLGTKLEVHLAGVIGDADRAPLPAGVVHAHGYLPHAQTIALLRSADLLFLPMHDLPDGVRSRIVPGKTYEYLGAGRPILGALPDGDARDLLVEAGNAVLCRPADVDAMARLVLEQVERAARGEPLPPPRADVLARYERRALTARLAAVFDHVTRAGADSLPIGAAVAG
ncbi:MAG TPA: glycosyltransferase [Gaiellaceae bacterium]|nr:glycosyltransferase [Gaiellaceae bacterium]